MAATGFFWDERCFWHAGGDYAFTLPVGGLVQPLVTAGLPENPETKRRLKNLLDVTGLLAELTVSSAPNATSEQLERVHPADFLAKFKAVSDSGGGELGLRTPFGRGGFEIASLSAGLSIAAISSVLRGDTKNAYALSRPPGHHCLPEFPNGFCLLANIAIAIEAAKAAGLAQRFAVVDWDVHHGNGTEAIFYGRSDVLSISIHQEHNYPLDTGDISDQGVGNGVGYNINIPLPPGAGHGAYVTAMRKLVQPALDRFKPDVIIVACGFDAAAVDPLGRMLCSAKTFGEMTTQMMASAQKLCDGKLVMVHEGGYSEVYVPFCGHAVLSELAGSQITAPDPLATTIDARQPNAELDAYYNDLITRYQKEFDLTCD